MNTHPHRLFFWQSAATPLTNAAANRSRERSKKRLLLATIALALFGFASPAPADTILYGSTGDSNINGGGRVYLIDVTTQTATLVGNTGFDRLGGIAFDTNGVPYGVSGGSTGPSVLFTFDLLTAQATPIGTVPGSFGVDGLRFDANNTLYGGAYDNVAGSGFLLTIDPASAVVLTQVGVTASGNGFMPGLAFSSGGILYGSRGNSSGHTEDLDLINPTTGQATAIGTATNVISDIAFGLDGILYGVSPDGTVYSINPTTGAETALFGTGLKLAGVASPQAVPEPSTWVLVAGGLGVALMTMRRRRA